MSYPPSPLPLVPKFLVYDRLPDRELELRDRIVGNPDEVIEYAAATYHDTPFGRAQQMIADEQLGSVLGGNPTERAVYHGATLLVLMALTEYSNIDSAQAALTSTEAARITITTLLSANHPKNPLRYFESFARSGMNLNVEFSPTIISLANHYNKHPTENRLSEFGRIGCGCALRLFYDAWKTVRIEEANRVALELSPTDQEWQAFIIATAPDGMTEEPPHEQS